ncbi:Uncharacterized protein FWK35_00024286 [Aphis craccivora]|uniref:Uncharacterized protein n=1 Tax=Aphis craccivora TaxID=307492 RepID=A0A6G0WB82_APHCR|nr:Uncharacterized protein FWK35_00024286 [Aphis craccivora]
MTWSIVHFVVDDTVEVVPSQWIKRNGYCAWPKTLKMNDVKKLLVVWLVTLFSKLSKIILIVGLSHYKLVESDLNLI